MAYPPFIQRHTNFRQQESAGQPFSTAALDADLNDSYETANQINLVLRGITTAAGRLQNVAAQIAAALVGSQRFTVVVAGPPTILLTTIAWQATFSPLNVQVVNNGLAIDPNTVTVADSGGFLQVTLSDVVAIGWVRVSAYEQGAGLLTRLASISDPADGANMVGVQDVDGHFVAVTVEGALAELAADLEALITSLGTIANLWTANGASLGGTGALANWDLGGFNIKDLANAVDPQDAVTLAQVQALVQNLDTLLTIFVRSDGSVDFTADQSMGDNKLTDVADPTAAQDAVNKQTLDAEIASSEETSLAVLGLTAGTTRGTLTGPVTLDELPTATADVDQTTNPGAVAVHTITGVPRPGAPGHAANRQYVDDQIDIVLSGGDDITANATADGTGLGGGGPATLVPGGQWFFETLTVPAAQALTEPLRIVCEGDLTIEATGSMTSGYPIEMVVGGNVLIEGAITCAHLVIRAQGSITVAAAIDCTPQPTWSRELPGRMSFVWDQSVYLQAGAALTISSTISAHDIVTFSRTDTTISNTLRAFWRGWPERRGLASVFDLSIGTARAARFAPSGSPDAWDAETLSGYGWFTGTQGNSAQNANIGVSSNGAGGGGGTAGGIGGRNQTNAASTHRGLPIRGSASNRPHCQVFTELARGGQGTKSSDNTAADITQALGGGRISVAALGNLILTGATLDANGLINGGTNSSDRGGGGGGVVRAVAGGEITGGTLTANGGAAIPGALGAGGGGMVATIAESVAVAPTATANGGVASSGGDYNGAAGTVIQELLTAAQIQLLFDRNLFAIPPLEPIGV